MKFFCLVILLFFGLEKVSAQDSTHKLLRDKNFVALPVVFRLPETRWGGGVGGVATFGFAKDSINAKLSQISFGTTFTQNKQILIFMPFKIFTNNGKYYFASENGWFRYNYIYSGIGENRVPEEKYDADYERVRLLATRAINAKTYVGLRVNFENYVVTKTKKDGELASGIIDGSDKSRTLGLGLSFLKDTRDQVFYPRKGVFGEFFIVPSGRFFGANRNFTKISADFAFYKSLTNKTVWASNYVAIANLGNVPFNQLAYLGGQSKMRGIFEGYFRDKNALMIQQEVRQEVWKRLGAVAFGSVGFMGSEHNHFLRLNKPKFTYGAGLRIATKNHLNLRLDYALSPYTGGNFYATIGEAF
ncbi:BamA/TamA family outer membrane protein [Emticicia oligotrophica]|nr:BamA/TamA family outer membrane protein [Emticicia oligotrophica]